MSNAVAFAILILAALLEVGGDAVIRSGLQAPALPLRVGLIVLGGVVLTAYGLVVNAPPWDFGRLLGVYVAVFFVVAQIVNIAIFKVAPSPPILAGGALILFGGLAMTFWRTP